MFDFSFSELMLIGVVALVVIGPERLPKVARTTGQWLGRLNRYAAQVKQEIDQDMKLEELRKMQQEMKDTAQRFEIQTNETLQRVEETVTQETGAIAAMSTVTEEQVEHATAATADSTLVSATVPTVVSAEVATAALTLADASPPGVQGKVGE